MQRDKLINLDERNHEYFKKLTEARESPFYKRLIKDVFIMAMGLGHNMKHRKKLSKIKGTIPVDTMENDRQAIWLIRAIAVSEEGLDILHNPKEVYRIAEEYANGGIKELWEYVFESKPGDFDKQLDSDLRKMI